MRYFSLIYLPCLFLFFLSCTKKEEESNNKQEEKEVSPLIEIPSESEAIFSQGVSFDYNKDSRSVVFSTNAFWSAEVIDTKASGWLTIQPTSGGAARVKMSILADTNLGLGERESVVSIKCGTMTKSFKVKQSGMSMEVITEGPYVKINHTSSTFTAPSIGKGDERIISWEPGVNDYYIYGISHTYSKEGEHTIILQTKGSERCTFLSLEGISHIDFSNY